MRKMSYIVLAAVAIFAVSALVLGCQSCKQSTNTNSQLPNTNTGVPADIADARLISYKYTLCGTVRYPLYSESVEICPDDSTRCIIRLFDEAHSTDRNFDKNGDLLPDTIVAGIEVLDSVKQMIIDAKAWRFKEDYSPRAAVMDGYSWGYTATFSVTDSQLSSTPEAQRARLLRRGGRILTSGGSNAGPDTRLFEQIRTYLRQYR